MGLALSPSAAAALIVIIGAAIASCVGALGFDIVREYTQRSRWGVAIGTVNTGGFVSSIIAVELVGLILDLRGGARTGSDFIVCFWRYGRYHCSTGSKFADCFTPLAPSGSYSSRKLNHS